MRLIEAKNISVSFGESTVINNVSFNINQGDVMAIIGPNGGGKTTLMRAILGFIPHEGHVHWEKEIKVGYVPQDLDFDRNFPITVRELFKMKLQGSVWFKKDDKHIKKILKKTGSHKLINKKIGNLSGGELQRVLIAYALSDDPKILFLDEPAAGIDIGGEMTIYNLIHDLSHHEKLTVVFISHDLEIVYSHANQVLCLNNKLVCKGIPSKVLTDKKISEMYGDHATHYSHKH